MKKNFHRFPVNQSVIEREARKTFAAPANLTAALVAAAAEAKDLAESYLKTKKSARWRVVYSWLVVDNRVVVSAHAVYRCSQWTRGRYFEAERIFERLCVPGKLIQDYGQHDPAEPNVYVCYEVSQQMSNGFWRYWQQCRGWFVPSPEGEGYRILATDPDHFFLARLDESCADIDIYIPKDELRKIMRLAARFK